MDENELIQKGEYPEDRLNRTKTIYEVSSSEIIWRNFLAGFSRGSGAIIAYVLFFGLISFLVTQFIWPVIGPLIGDLLDMTKSLQNLQNLQLQKAIIPDNF